MDSLRYLDFELQVSRQGDQYRAEILRSPAGEASQVFSLPFSPEGLENLVLRLSLRGRGSRAVPADGIPAARELGGKLFEAVFAGELRACLRRSLDEADSQPNLGLRIKLRFEDAGELAELPWEYLYDASTGRFIAQSTYTPLVRYVEMPQRIRPITASLPLRILVMVSDPEDPDYPRLDVATEKQRIAAALQPLVDGGRVEIDWLETATLAALQRQLSRNQYHAFHFVGHGAYDEAAHEGVLILEDELGRGQRTSAQRLGPILHDSRSLRLAFLNSCEGARNSRSDPFAGVATNLLRQGIPAVVAMQFEITDEAAIAFSSGFYAALADGYPVDMAVSEGRKAILVQPNDVEWATPVLFMRSADGVLFQIEPQTPQPASDPTLIREQADDATIRRPVMDAATLVPGKPDDVSTIRRPEPTPAEFQTIQIPSAPSNARDSISITAGNNGAYSLNITNVSDVLNIYRLSAHTDVPGFSFRLATSVPVSPGATARTVVNVVPERKRGERQRVPFTVTAEGSGGGPPLVAHAEYESAPGGGGLPLFAIAGGALAAAVVAIALVLGVFSGDDSGATAGVNGAPTVQGGPTAASGLVPVPTSSLGSLADTVIYFVSTRPPDASARQPRIWVMDGNGENLNQLSLTSSHDNDPSASRNGALVAFVSDSNGDSIPEALVMNNLGGDLRRVSAGSVPESEPDISWDGRRVAFERQPSPGQYMLFVTNLETNVTTPLNITGIDPDWAPDDSRLVFAARPSEYPAVNVPPDTNRDVLQLYVINADGSNGRLVTNSTVDLVEPAWSPDGRRIAYQAGGGDESEIWVINQDGTNPVRLTNNRFPDEDPVWSPDGSLIAFHSFREQRNWDIYTINMAGEEKNITNHPDDDRKPSWVMKP